MKIGIIATAALAAALLLACGSKKPYEARERTVLEDAQVRARLKVPGFMNPPPGPPASAPSTEQRDGDGDWGALHPASPASPLNPHHPARTRPR